MQMRSYFVHLVAYNTMVKPEFKMDIVWKRFIIFILCSGDVAADVNHLHIKRIHLLGFCYIVIEDSHGKPNVEWHARRWRGAGGTRRRTLPCSPGHRMRKGAAARWWAGMAACWGRSSSGTARSPVHAGGAEEWGSRWQQHLQHQGAHKHSHEWARVYYWRSCSSVGGFAEEGRDCNGGKGWDAYSFASWFPRTQVTAMDFVTPTFMVNRKKKTWWEGRGKHRDSVLHGPSKSNFASRGSSRHLWMERERE
jgi:hypothetical protein